MAEFSHSPMPGADLTVGLAVGLGTGPKLGDVFRTAFTRLGAEHGIAVRLREAPQRFHTYFSIVRAGENLDALSHADARAYAAYVRELYSAGCRVMFRTAINAQSLYLAREALTAVKIEALSRPEGELLVVRDEAQGFYAGDNRDAGMDAFERRCVFSRDVLRRVIRCAVEEAAARWGGVKNVDHVVAAYKFHILPDAFALWVKEIADELGVTIHLQQPDTVNRNLLRGAYRGRLLVIGANEWGDAAHADLIARYTDMAQDERCSRNVYLADDVAGFEEFQTVHGSADDLAGRNIVNPAATLRAAAAIFTAHGHIADAASRMDDAIAAARDAGISTPDAGGDSTTSETVEAVLAAYARGPRLKHPSRSALVIVDAQNDFCSVGGHFDRLGLVKPANLAAAASRLDRLAQLARRAGVPVVFTQTLQNPETLNDAVRERATARRAGSFVQPDTWGADFSGPRPEPGDIIAVKENYDAFLNPSFEKRLRREGVSHLVVGGFFADVCVDALVRTAYQRGFRVTVLRDGTAALRRHPDETLAFMREFYNADMATCEDASATWQQIPVTSQPRVS